MYNIHDDISYINKIKFVNLSRKVDPAIRLSILITCVSKIARINQFNLSRLSLLCIGIRKKSVHPIKTSLRTVVVGSCART